jgi:uncharacterized protein (DUF1800 family)
MKHRHLLAVIVTLLPLLARAEGSFTKAIPADKKAIHALNRLTFGPRPSDLAEVQKVGVEKWIQLQLHPERIPENPTLDERLKPLETLRLDPGQILKDYPAVPPGLAPPQLNDLLPSNQLQMITNGAEADRVKFLNTLDPEKRKQIMGILPPMFFVGLAGLQKEAEDARKAVQEDRQKQLRSRMPPLNELLTPDQVSTAIRGNRDQLIELMNYLDPVKRQQVAAALPPQALAELPEYRRMGIMLRQPRQVIGTDLKQGKVFRAIYSNRQLEEVLVDFWFNHFNVYEAKGQVLPLLSSYERDAIRPHVLGKFKDLLLATAQHPAMLYYLDNWESISPAAFEIGPFAGQAQNMAQQLQRQARGLNENYGREVMELHTMGVNGGYTQDDVIAVARCFTGWTIRQPNTQPEFVFAGFMHDSSEKTVLGHKIPAGGGEQDGLQVIDILAHHPSTARFISLKLAQRFVADDPPASLVDRMAQTFTKTDGDLRAVMETMFTSAEFFSEGAWQAKLKSPLEMVVSSVRASDADVIDTFTLVQKIADLGEPLYGKLEPTGYPTTGESWLSTANVMGRLNFANTLMSGQIPGVKLNVSRLDGLEVNGIARELLGRNASPQTQDALATEMEGKPTTTRFVAGLVFASPDFQRR